MRRFSIFKKLFPNKPKTLGKEIAEAAEKFKDVDVNSTITIQGGGQVGQSRGSIPLPGVPGGNARASYPGYGAGNVQIPLPRPPSPPPGSHSHQITMFEDLGLEQTKEKRQRIVGEERAKAFIEQLNKKIAILIRLRAEAKTIEESNTLTLSIDTLEMTRELVQEVFINQIKD